MTPDTTHNSSRSRTMKTQTSTSKGWLSKRIESSLGWSPRPRGRRTPCTCWNMPGESVMKRRSSGACVDRLFATDGLYIHQVHQVSQRFDALVPSTKILCRGMAGSEAVTIEVIQTLRRGFKIVIYMRAVTSLWFLWLFIRVRDDLSPRKVLIQTACSSSSRYI